MSVYNAIALLCLSAQGSCFTPSCAASMLYSPRVWLEAATQIFFSLGLAQGALISLSTYTTEKMKAVRQSVFVGVVNAFTSLVVAIVVYSVLGFQATQEGADLQEVGGAVVGGEGHARREGWCMLSAEMVVESETGKAITGT